jgi:hypothetical protein
MRTFVSALLVSATVAQTNSTNSTVTTVVNTVTTTTKNAWDSVTNWFATTTQKLLSESGKKQDLGTYAPKSLTNTTWTQGLHSHISMDSTPLGVNFVTVSLDLYSNVTAHFNNGTNSQVWFQVQQPAASARLLQNTTTTTAAATMWEGWMGVRAGQAVTTNLTSGAATLAVNKNTWGKTDLTSDVQHFTKFGGAEAVNTNATYPWQLADAKLQTFTAQNLTAGTPHNWHAQVWRVATVSDSIHFKFVTGTNYWGHSGHRFWKNGSGVVNASESNTSGHVSFMLDDATTTFLGLGAVAAMVMTMF